MRRRKSRGQAMVEFALLSGLLFLLVMGIFDFGRAIAVYINIAEAAHEGARQLVLRSNYNSTPPDKVVIDATLAKIGGGGMVLTEDPCLSNQNPPCASPSMPTVPNTGFIWITPPPVQPGSPACTNGCRTTGNLQVTVRVTYLYAPMTGMISNLTGASFIMTAGSSMRAEY
jgi:Flp pilus assembly protein TadG